MYYIISKTGKQVFRSTSEAKLRKQYEDMLSYNPDSGITFSNVKPVPVRTSIKVSVLPYTDPTDV